MKKWSKSELEYLDEAWGKTSIKKIAQKLNRSENAVKIKAQRINKGAFLENGEYISCNQLFRILGIDYGYSLNKWIKEYNFPIKKQKVNNNYFNVVKIEKFWECAEKNQYLLNFSYFQKHSLGKEPQWVNIKREKDKSNQPYSNKRLWTSYEDERLCFLVKKHQYTYLELSQILKRSTGAISRRLKDLNIKDLPLRHENKQWTDEEIASLKDNVINGFSYEVISEKLNRSSKSIRDKLFGLYGTEVLHKVKNILEKEVIYND